MWKNTLLIFLQNNNHCREKHDCYISLHKINGYQPFPTCGLPTAAFNEKTTRDGHLTNITSK